MRGECLRPGRNIASRLGLPTPMRALPILVAVVAAIGASTSPAEASAARVGPAEASAAPSRFFGVVYDRDVSDAAPATQDQQFALMRKTGVQSVRRVFSWAAAQPEEGQPPNLADTD